MHDRADDLPSLGAYMRRLRQSMCELSSGRRGPLPAQRQTREDLAVVVDDCRLDESECCVETGWTALAKRVAGQQLCGTLTSYQFHDLPHDLVAIAEALVTVVDEQLPQKPRADDSRRLRVDIPSQHDEPDGSLVGVNGPKPWVRLGDLGSLYQGVDHRGDESLLIQRRPQRLDRIDIGFGELSKADRHAQHVTPCNDSVGRSDENLPAECRSSEVSASWR